MTSVTPADTFTELLARVFEQVPIAISVYDHTGLQVASNAATAALWNIQREQWIGHFNMITDPQLAAQGSAERHQQVMQGETLVLPPGRFSGRQTGLQDDAGGYRWIQATYLPLRDDRGAVTHLMAILRDVSEEVEQRAAIQEAQMEIQLQQDIIDVLSSPVIALWQDVLLVPLVGAISSRRALKVTEKLLNTISARQAQCVIIDITGVPLVDTQVAQYLAQTARACRLLGCEVVLVGVGPDIAQTLVQLSIDLDTIMTLSNLQAGLAWALTRLHWRITAPR